jgi:hydroxymethylglutaryl-CoA lyase
MEIPVVKLVECPRDAMQGIETFIPTDVKVKYLNGLLKVGFDTIDIGSFVSPKAIPQLADTAEVLDRIDLDGSKSKLLVIVANERGAEAAARQVRVSYWVIHSASARPSNSATRIPASRARGRVQRTSLNLAQKAGKELVVYISMAFGNPYGDPWNAEVALHWTDRLVNELGVRIIALSDTVGVANPRTSKACSERLSQNCRRSSSGHICIAAQTNWKTKTQAAWDAGCRRFDGAIKGYGGCPMAEDELVGNLQTELFVRDLEERGINTGVDLELLDRSVIEAGSVFPA